MMAVRRWTWKSDSCVLIFDLGRRGRKIKIFFADTSNVNFDAISEYIYIQYTHTHTTYVYEWWWKSHFSVHSIQTVFVFSYNKHVCSAILLLFFHSIAPIIIRTQFSHCCNCFIIFQYNIICIFQYNWHLSKHVWLAPDKTEYNSNNSNNNSVCVCVWDWFRARFKI